MVSNTYAVILSVSQCDIEYICMNLKKENEFEGRFFFLLIEGNSHKSKLFFRNVILHKYACALKMKMNWKYKDDILICFFDKGKLS